jgi:outer membrane protein assembly factor BamD
MGDRFENQQAAAYSKIIREYPLSPHVDEAKARLEEMKRPVPEADPVAYARMKYELENRTNKSFLGKVWAPFSGKPDTSAAAKSGSPQMVGFRPSIPVSVPAAASGATGVTDVGVSVPTDPSAIDKNPDARANPSGTAATTGAATGTANGAAPASSSTAATAPANQPPPSNHVMKPKKVKKSKAKKNSKEKEQPSAAKDQNATKQ